MKRKLILLELNEVPFRVVDEYCARRPHSPLARLLNRSVQYETVTEDEGHLSPWITWPSVHRGVSNVRHGIECFGQELQEVDRHFPPVWQLLARQGIPTGVFGSLHSYGSFNTDGAYAFYLPDTFAAGSECFPQRLKAFQEFNLAMVQDSPRNVSSRIRWQPALRLLAAAPGLGLKPQTMLDVGGQLVAERLNPARRVRRRTYQALLAFDLFYKQLRQTRPAMATFFTNHVASAMHRYWAATFPQDYDEFGFDRQWVATYGDEIGFALRKLDVCLARLLKFVDANPDYQLWVATSMGQAATTAQPMEAQLYITDLPRFVAALGIPAAAWQRRPAMAPDSNFVVEPAFVAAAQAALEQLQVNGRPLEARQSPGGLFSIRLGQPYCAQRPNVVTRGGQTVPLEELGMANVPIEDQSNTTAYHIPQGMLLVYDPRSTTQRAARTQISTVEIAPAILRYFALHVPSYMTPARWSAAA